MGAGAGNLTDRERALQAEARVIELEDQLAAYRDARKEDLAEEAAAQREAAIAALMDRVKALAPKSRSVRLLALFLERPGRVVLKHQITEHLNSYEFDPESNSPNVRVHYLRKLLALLGLPTAIQTVWGRGYLLARDAAEQLEAMLAEGVQP